MLQLELPHVNVLSKMDLVTKYGDLRELTNHHFANIMTLTSLCGVDSTIAFNLEYYTEVQDLEYLAGSLKNDRAGEKYVKLNKVICELVEDYGLVGFETLAVEVSHTSLETVIRVDTMRRRF